MKDETPRIIKQFKEYHRLNPTIYELFKETTLKLLAQGKSRGMSLGIIYNIRWEVEFAIKGDFYFKVNNSCATGYSRLFELEFPQHKGFFHMKKSIFDNYDLADLL